MCNLNFRFGVRGNANFSVFRYQHVGIGNAKLWHWGLQVNARTQREWFCVAVEYRLVVALVLHGSIFNIRGLIDSHLFFMGSLFHSMKKKIYFITEDLLLYN